MWHLPLLVNRAPSESVSGDFVPLSWPDHAVSIAIRDPTTPERIVSEHAPMLELVAEPPSAEAIAKVTSIEGVRVVMRMLTATGTRPPPGTLIGTCGAHPAKDLRR